jgi:ATP-dependent helicase/nuclease subunit A
MTALADQLAADRAARRAAQTTFDRPLVLEAGAGTGKTTTLVARLLAWCLGEGWERARARRAASPEAETGSAPGAAGAAGERAAGERVAAGVLSRVVAITFTEAAAAEMAGRAARELASLAAGGAPPSWLDAEALPEAAERMQRARSLLGTLDHLTVRTVHAFCLRLLADHPLEAGVHPGLQVDAEGERLAEVVREVVESSLRQGYGDPGDPHLLALAGAGWGPPEIEAALAALAQAGMTARDLAADPFDAPAVAALGGRLAAACSALHALLAPCLGAVRHGNARALGKAVAALPGQLATALNGPSGPSGPSGPQAPAATTIAAIVAAAAAALPENLRHHLREWSRCRFGKHESELLGEGCGPLAARAEELARLLDHLERLDPERLGHARQALAPLAAVVERELARRGIATFDSLLTGAEKLLAGHPAVREEVRRGIDQLLVDEFQDTDRVQCEILRWLALDGPREQRPGLFLVGDPKQSIYGWRSADLVAYDRFIAGVRAAGGEVLPLTLNFRSVPAILDEVARVIAPVMRERAGLQPRFEPLLPCEDKRGETGFCRGGRGAVEHWVSASAGAANAPVLELEAAAIAADLRSLHQAEGVAWREMALLLRGTGNLEVYLDALRRAAVPFAVGRDKQYFRRREVIEAAALVRAVLDPGDHLALLTVLRSPAVGVPDAALVPLWRHGFPDRLTELLEPAPAALSQLAELVGAAVLEVPAEVPGLDRVRGWEVALLAAVEHLAVLRASFAADPADLFVERLRRLFLLEATAAARSLGSYRLANLERFFRRLLAAMEEGGGDVTTVLRVLRASVAESRDAEEGRPQEGFEDAVSVLTIHGAKGLDFDHVYLPQLHKPPPPPEAAPAAQAGRTAAGRREYRLFGAPTPGFDLVEAERREVEAAERVRLLYVAMTRAKQRLVLIGAWPEAAVAPPERCRTHLEVLLWRPHRPDLAALRAELRQRGGEAGADATGARWRFLDLAAAHPDPGEPGENSAAARSLAPTAAAGAALPSPAEVVAAAGLLAARRAAAAARMRRSFGGAASEEAHALLREQMAERWAGTSPAGTAAPAAGAGRDLLEAHRDGEREVAMAAGAALHRALESWDLSAEPRREMERQRRLLAAYLAAAGAPREGVPAAGAPAAGAPAAGSPDPAARALARAERLLERFAAGGLLARLCALGPRVLARELPVLLPPAVDGKPEAGRASGSPDGAGEAAAVGPAGFVSGSIDLLYRDASSGLPVVADYKTDDVEDPAELARRAAVYAPQGAAYARAAAAALGTSGPLRFELWFVLAGRVVELPLPAIGGKLSL